MYTRKLLYLTLVVLLILPILVDAQDPNRSLGRFRSGGGFGMDVPEKPQKVEPLNFFENGVCSTGRLYLWSADKGFTIGAGYLKLSKCGKLIDRAVIEKTAGDFVSAYSKVFQTGESTVDEGPIEVGDLRGGQLVLTTAERTLVMRTFISGERIFFCYIVVGAEFTGSYAVRPLDTFRLLSRSELNDAKIAEATPDALPQARVLSKLGTDAAELNLRGKVKTVSEYTLTSSNEKFMRSEIEFDRNRERLRSVEYSDGYPSSVTAWGSIDGARVSLSRTILFDEDQRRPASEFENVLIQAPRSISTPPAASSGPTPKPTPKPTPDKRYSVKYVYVYGDDGAITERLVHGNDDSLRTRTVYKRVDSKREIEIYDATGRRYLHRFEILDENGNVIESWFDNEAGKKSSTYKYKFDSAGNWVEQKIFRKVITGGKPAITLTETVYRSIAYYD